MEEQEGILQCKTNYYLLVIVLLVIYYIFNLNIPFVRRLSINLVIILFIIAIEITRIRTINFDSSSICVNTYANKKVFFYSDIQKIIYQVQYLSYEEGKDPDIIFYIQIKHKNGKTKEYEVKLLIEDSQKFETSLNLLQKYCEQYNIQLEADFIEDETFFNKQIPKDAVNNLTKLTALSNLRYQSAQQAVFLAQLIPASLMAYKVKLPRTTKSKNITTLIIMILCFMFMFIPTVMLFYGLFTIHDNEFFNYLFLGICFGSMSFGILIFIVKRIKRIFSDD